MPRFCDVFFDYEDVMVGVEPNPLHANFLSAESIGRDVKDLLFERGCFFHRNT